MSTVLEAGSRTTDSIPSAAPQALRSTLNGLPESTRDEMVELLNQLLADTLDLHSQVKQAHWNVRGMHFQPLHELFDAVAAVLPGFGDELAERVGMLGGAAVGTARAASENSRLPEIDRDLLDGEAATRAVAERIALVTNAMRFGIDRAGEAGDEITADLLTEITRELDKQLWFVESHLMG